MKIVVMSDTHSRELPQQLLEDASKADLIVHLGDFCAMEDYLNLQKIKEVKAVCGNMDEAALCEALPEQTTFACENKKIGLFHGKGQGHSVLSMVQEEFKGHKVDAVVFGHSHYPFNEEIKGTLYFNPGSPTDKIFAPYCSYGILEIDDSGIKGRIVKVK